MYNIQRFTFLMIVIKTHMFINYVFLQNVKTLQSKSQLSNYHWILLALHYWYLYQYQSIFYGTGDQI